MTLDTLDEVELTGIDEHPPTQSVKLYGPPGTGKTTQSAGRVARLLRDHDYTIGDVAWCTYRRSLADETLNRLCRWGVLPEEQLEKPKEGPTKYISTFHAVASRSVGGVGDMVGWGEKKDFCGLNNLRLRKRHPWDRPPGEMLFQAFNYMANNLLDPHSQKDRNEVPVLDDLMSVKAVDVGVLWDEWQQYKQNHGVHDFYEQLKAPLEAETSPDKDILVIDEYHDATPLMAKLSEYWMSQAEIVILAGDPDQVVNNYAGADPEYFERVDLPEILLDKTYRVPYEHWSVASSILSNAHTPPQVDRNSSGVFGTFNSPQFLHEEEVGWTVPSEEEPQSPVWFIEEYGSDTMFLARTQKQADGLAVALEQAGVLFKTQNSMDRDGWGASGDSDMSTRTGLYNALQKLSELGANDFNTTTGLSRYANGSGRDPGAVKLRPPEVAAILDHASATTLAQSRDSTTSKIESIEEAGDPVTAEELNHYVKDNFWTTYTSGAASVSKLNKTGNHTENLRTRDQQALPPALTRNDDPVDDVETKVYTIHASKGTEASNVVVWDGVTNRIQKGTENDQATLENEWRTWYVALTRASERLFVGRGGFDWMNSWLPGSLKEQAEEANKSGAEA